jgi:hypothetical protein
MTKKTLLFIVLILAFVGGGVYVWQKEAQFPSSKEDAVRQAERYRPTGTCIQVLTPAVHTATGAEYTFSSGCLPDGWEAKRR